METRKIKLPKENHYSYYFQLFYFNLFFLLTKSMLINNQIFVKDFYGKIRAVLLSALSPIRSLLEAVILPSFHSLTGSSHHILKPCTFIVHFSSQCESLVTEFRRQLRIVLFAQSFGFKASMIPSFLYDCICHTRFNNPYLNSSD